MKTLTQGCKLALSALLAGAVLLGSGCSTMGKGTALSGAQEVPPNTSSATGRSTIWVAADKSVGGGVSIAGMVATAAHIHEAPAGANGPVVVPLTKVSDTEFAVSVGATLTDAQYASFMAGKLYVNVHSAAYPGGEIRAQLMPK
ncbi:MAG: CHRD domain-containing protein [Burkholderiaceae bacterium]|nr:CHRD domain-containing protein [Burkholderiaceae bacterium]